MANINVEEVTVVDEEQKIQITLSEYVALKVENATRPIQESADRWFREYTKVNHDNELLVMENNTLKGHIAELEQQLKLATEVKEIKENTF